MYRRFTTAAPVGLEPLGFAPAAASPELVALVAAALVAPVVCRSLSLRRPGHGGLLSPPALSGAFWAW